MNANCQVSKECFAFGDKHMGTMQCTDPASGAVTSSITFVAGRCGDGYVDDDCTGGTNETCDEEGPECLGCRDTYVVFASSTLHTGDLGGISGADAICQNLADASGACPTGTYKAWLATDTYNPLTSGLWPDGVFVNTQGQVVSYTLDGLSTNDFETCLENAVRYDENGANPTYTSNVWCGNWYSGNSSHPYTCQGWTLSTNVDGEFGCCGNYYESDGRWTCAGGLNPCDNQQHIYCFQVD